MKKIVFIIFLFIIAIHSNGQRNELAITGGVSYYMGDINPEKHFHMINPAGGATFRHNINPRWTFKASALYLKVNGDDAVTKYDEKRNLSFKSNIYELAAIGEFNFFPYMLGNRKYPYSPFIFAGLSVFKFNPKANYEGTWYELQPLGTEGQGTSYYPDRKPYSLAALAVPFGIGFKANLTRKFGIVAEWGMRKTFTDYLDDVSKTYANPQVLAAENTIYAMYLGDRTIKEPGDRLDNTGYQRGNSKNMDWYSYAGLSITYRIFRQKTCCAYKRYPKHAKYSFD